MNKLLILVLAICLITSLGVAQQADSRAQATATQTSPAASTQLAAGSTLQVVLSKSIDAKKAKANDPVLAKTTSDARADGKVIIPKGTKVFGHVTEAKARAKNDSESMVGIAFDKAVLKNGQEIPLSATIQAIGAAEQNSALAAQSEPIAAPQASGPGYGRAASGGIVTNTTQTVGAAAGGVANTAGSTVGPAGGAQTGVVLNSSSRGVVGISGIELQAASSSQTNASVVTSKDKNVKLDSGTQMILQVQSR